MGEANVWQPRSLVDLIADTKRVTESFTATANQTLFTIVGFTYALGTGALEVFKNGVHMELGVDFTEGTTSTFSLVVPATLNDKIVVVGYTGITGTVDVRDTDIFVTNYQAIRDYAGTETLLFAQGKTTVGDTGENFFQKFTGAAIGTYVDDDLTILRPTGGDGTIGWVRTQEQPVIKSIAHNMTADPGGGAYTLTDLQNTYPNLEITDTGALLTGSTNIEIGSVERLFYMKNSTAQILTPYLSLPPLVSIAAGEEILLRCDGTDIVYANGTRGSFLPELWDSKLGVGVATDPTYSVQQGWYSIIENRFFYDIWMTMSSLGTLVGTDPAHIGNFPVIARSGMNSPGSFVAFSGMALPAAKDAVECTMGGGTDKLSLSQWTATTGVSAMHVDKLTAAASFYISGSFLIN